MRSGDSDGAPPCRRCAQEQQECVLVKSRRGGRRVKRSLAIPNSSSLPPPQTPVLTHAAQSNTSCGEVTPSATGAGEDRWQSRPAASPRQGLRQWDDGWQETASGSTTLRRQSSAPSDIENHIASADLLNPSDALDLLAQVADRDAAESRGDLLQHVNRNSIQKGISQQMNPQSAIFPPIADGYLAVTDVLPLLKQYVCRLMGTLPSQDKLTDHQLPREVPSILPNSPQGHFYERGCLAMGRQGAAPPYSRSHCRIQGRALLGSHTRGMLETYGDTDIEADIQGLHNSWRCRGPAHSRRMGAATTPGEADYRPGRGGPGRLDASGSRHQAGVSPKARADRTAPGQGPKAGWI